VRRINLPPAIPLAAALIAAAFALAACGGNEGDDAAPTAGPATQPTPATGTTAPAAPTGIKAGLIDPGTYKSEPFEPALRLTIDEQGWLALFAPEDDELAFEHQDGRFLAFTRVTRVVDPQTNRDVPAPKDLAQWLREHPALQPTQAAPLTVGGASGTRIDAAPTKSDTDIFWYTGGAMHADPDVRWRVIVVDAGGTPLTIVIGAPKASFDQALTKIQPLLASIEFD
jgi:hypothetical protein